MLLTPRVCKNYLRNKCKILHICTTSVKNKCLKRVLVRDNEANNRQSMDSNNMSPSFSHYLGGRDTNGNSREYYQNGRQGVISPAIVTIFSVFSCSTIFQLWALRSNHLGALGSTRSVWRILYSNRLHIVT